MTIGIARQDIEYLPAQQVLEIIGGVAGNILNQLVTLRKGRAAGWQRSGGQRHLRRYNRRRLKGGHVRRQTHPVQSTVDHNESQ